MKLSYIPNLITCIRLLLIGPVLYSLMHAHYLQAFILFMIAGLTDALDGLLARLFGWTSRFGAIADPLADKLLLMSSFLALYALNLIPIWLMVAIVGRDLWILLGVLSYRCLIGQFQVDPSTISKINTFLQIFLVLMLLLNLSVFTIPSILLTTCNYAVLITSVGSFIHYTWVWSIRALQAQHVKQLKSQLPKEA